MSTGKAGLRPAVPQEGAIHMVDAVWAYFDAQGEGVVAMAAKRAKNFRLGEREPATT